MSVVALLKKFPIDLGQAGLKHSSYGKHIALSIAGEGRGSETLLDLGCRDGYFSLLLEKRGFKVTSVDIECRYEKCQRVDADKPLPFSDQSFDVIWCSEVIEHLVDPAFTIKEFRRVLKSGGRAVLTTPNSGFWLYSLLRLFGLSPKDVQNPGHRHFFTLKDIQALGPEDGIVYGFFPYALYKRRISHLVGLLSPTFVFSIRP